MRYDPCPWGAHSLLNTSSKLNTGHASWVVHSFIIETPFHLCLAAIHTDIQRKQQDMWKCTLEEPGKGEEASHLSCRGSLSMLAGWLTDWEDAREACPTRAAGTRVQLLRITLREPSGNQEQIHWHIVPSGCTCTDCRSSIVATARALLPKLQLKEKDLRQIPGFVLLPKNRGENFLINLNGLLWPLGASHGVEEGNREMFANGLQNRISEREQLSCILQFNSGDYNSGKPM